MGQAHSGVPEPSHPRVEPRPQARGWRVSAPLTTILGREADIAAITALLDREDVRLVTLTGPGGIGKTRLAREVALRLQNVYAHGACFVPLADLDDPELIPSAIASALGLQLVSDRSAMELVQEALADRHLLLVIDNLEHLIDEAAPWLSTLLQHAPRLAMLATSRIPLRIAGERRFTVDPLDLPEDDPLPDPRSVSGTSSAAVALFAERARAIQPAFELTDDNADDVARICRMLDGLPLAIELAAVQTRLLSPVQLVSRLEGSLTTLQTDLRDAPARHRTMRAAIAWGYELLDPDAQRLFRWLSVFTGGFSFVAAQDMARVAGLEDPHTVMLELVEHNFLRRRESGPDGYRFSMLQVVREFGAEQLEASGEQVAARDAHAAWVLGLAREAEPRMSRPEQVEWLDRLEQEHDNIRRAIGWLTEQGRVEEALDLTGSLWFFRWIRGYYDEARRRFELLLAHPAGQARTVARAKALTGLGIIASHQGESDLALRVFEEAIGILQELGAQWYLSLALSCYGTAHCYIGQIEACERHLLASQAIATQLGDEWLRQGPVCNLGVIAFNRGQMDHGRELMEESVRLSSRIGDRWGLALGEGNLGFHDMQQGRLDEAEAHYQRSIGLIHELGDKRDLPLAYTALAEIRRQRGQLAEARSMLNDALSVARDIGDQIQLASVLAGIAHITHLQGDHRAALTLMRDAMRAFSRSGHDLGALMCLDGVADMALALGDAEHAAWCIGVVDGATERSGTPRQETAPGEHQARVATTIAALGEPGYRQAHARGVATEAGAALAQAYAWQPPATTPATAGKTQSAPSLSPEAASLSPREREVLRLMADGLTNQEIADTLFLSHRTATSHTSSILGKLGLTTRTAAVAYAIRNGLA